MALKRKQLTTSLFGLSILVTMLAFQNCSRSQFENFPQDLNSTAQASSPAPATGEVSGTTADLRKISYDPSLNAVVTDVASLLQMKVLEVDLDNGGLTIATKNRQMKWSCQLKTEDEQALKSILSVARICHPSAVAEGAQNQLRCQAIAIEDLQLFNENRRVGLSHVVCLNGTYLCDGLDEKLRTLLQSLLSSDVSTCQAM